MDVGSGEFLCCYRAQECKGMQRKKTTIGKFKGVRRTEKETGWSAIGVNEGTEKRSTTVMPTMALQIVIGPRNGAPQ